MTEINSFWNPQRARLIIVSGLAAGLGLVLLAGMRNLEPQWLFCIALGFTVFWTAIMSRKFERFMFLLLFLVIPVNIDIHFNIGPSLDALQLPIGTPRFGISIMDIILLILYPIWISRLMVNPGERKILWPAGAGFFWCFMGCGALTLLKAPSVEIGVALWISFFRAFLLFFYTANHIKNREDLWLAAWCVAVGMAFEGLICLAQKTAGGNLGLAFMGEHSQEKEMAMAGSTVFRVGGTQGHPNALGGYFTSTLPVALALCLAPVSKFKRVIMAGCFGLGLLGTFLSFSRSAWYMAFAACAVLAGVVFFSQRKRFGQLMPALILGTFLLTVTGVALGPLIKARLEEDDKGSTMSRIPQWQMALSMIKSNPIFGVGMNNYNKVTHLYETYVVNTDGYGRVFLYQGRPHNVFIGIAAEMGIPGLLWLVGYGIVVSKEGIRQIRVTKDELIRLILTGMLLGFLGRIPHDAFHTGNLASHIFFWLYPACLVSRKEEKSQ